MRAETPEQVIGVIAHETGHFAGGHLARLQDELRTAETKSVIATVLGLAAGLAAGDGRVAGTIISGGSQAAFTGLYILSPLLAKQRTERYQNPEQRKALSKFRGRS